MSIMKNLSENNNKGEVKIMNINELFAKKQAEVAAKRGTVVTKTVENVVDNMAVRQEERSAVAVEIKHNQKLTGDKMAKILDVNKKRLSVKNQTNIMNIIFNGFSNDPDVEVDPSSIVYIQTMESELLRTYKEMSPLISEVRFTGNKVEQASRMINNIQDDVVIVTIKANDNVGQSMYRLFVTEEEVYVSVDDNFVEIISGKTYDKSILFCKKIKVYEGLLYSPSQEKKESITAFKVFGGNFSDFNNDVVTSGENKVLSILNDATNGMLNILKKKGQMDFKHAVKANARLSQILAPSEVLGLCSSYLLIMDDDSMTFTDGGGLYRALFMNKCLRNNYMEGFTIPEGSSAGKIIQGRPLGTKEGFVGARDSFIKALMSRLNVVKIKRSDITSEIQEQLELAFDKKGKFAPVTLNMLKDKIYKVVDNTLYEYEVNESIKQDVIDSFNGHGRFTVVNGNLTLITAVMIVDDMNIDVPDFTTDLNSFKAPVDFTRQAKFVALDESKGIDNDGRLSIQMELTLLLNGQKGIDYMRKAMLRNIEDNFSNLYENKGVDPTIESFNNFFLTGQLQTTAKDFVMKHDAPAFRTMVNHWINGQVSNLKRVNVLTKHSGYARLITDWSILLADLHILDEGECYSEDANVEYSVMLDEKVKTVIAAQPAEDENRITRKMLSQIKTVEDIKVTEDEATINAIKDYLEFRNKEHTVIVFRSPKMGLAEFGRFNALTKKQVVARIKERVKDEDLALTLIDFFKDLKPGTFMLPAFEKYKELLGGADFDFDGVTIIMDQDFIAAMEGIESVIISVKKNKGGSADKEYIPGDFKNVFNMAMKQWFNGNMGIGQITNMNDLVCLLLFVDDEIVRKLFRKNFVHETTQELKKYISPIKTNDEGVYEIDDTVTEMVVGRIRNAALKSHDEIVSIVYDLNMVLRGYQERTIDASKSGEVIKVLFNMLEDCTLLSIADKPDFSIDWSNHSVINKVRRDSTSVFKMKKGKRKGEFAFIINDEFHKILVKAYDLLAEKANKLIEHEVNIQLTADHLTFLSGVHKRYEEYDESLIYVSNRFKEANGIRISKINNLRDKYGRISKFTRKVLVPDITDEYNNTIAGITKMTRELLKDVSPVDRAALLKYIAIHSKDEDGLVTLNANGGSSICHTILPEEYLQLVLAIDAESKKFARSKIYGAGKYKEGDVAEVVNGLSVEANTNTPSFIGDKNLNGKFFVERDNNGAAYLVEDIEKLIHIDETNKRTVVVKLTPKVRGAYKRIIDQLNQDKPMGIKLTAYGKKCKEDKVEIITDGTIKRLCKFVAPSGTSPLGKMLDGFVGKITSVNYDKRVFETEDGSKKSYYTILVVAEEEDIEYKKANPFDRFNNVNSQVAADNTAAPKTAADLLASLKASKANKQTVEPAVTVTKAEDLGDYEDADIKNFLKGLRK